MELFSFQPPFARSCFWLLDMCICPIKDPRIWRYDLVLRKQSLIFLHFYHHVTVVLYSWFTYAETAAATSWYTVMNYFVHSWMSSYYTLKAMQYKLPKGFAIMITTMQLVQMVISCVATIAAYYYRKGCGL